MIYQEAINILRAQAVKTDIELQAKKLAISALEWAIKEEEYENRNSVLAEKCL